MDHTEAAAPGGDVPNQVGVGTGSNAAPETTGQSCVLSTQADSCSPGQGGQVALALPQQATFCPEISQKQIHGKDACFSLFTNVLIVCKL